MSTSAIDIALLTDNIGHQNDLLSLQNQILDQIVKLQKESQPLLDDLCRCAENLVPDALASIMLFDEKKEALTVHAAPSAPKQVIDDLQGLKPSLESGSCAHAVFTGEPTYVHNTLQDSRWRSLKDIVLNYEINACWSHPVFLNDDDAIGSFALSSFEQREPSDFQKNLLQVCANLVSIILLRKEQEDRLWRIAHHDALTGLPNRLYVDSQLKHAISNASRNQNCLALMFIDMDNFKYINDSYGHDYGDQVLLHSMDLIKGCLREGDIVARHGGDEFLLILENLTDKMAVEVIAKKILTAFRSPLLIENRKIAVHFSIGISLYPDDGLSTLELMKNADIAMYQAKANGKNSIQHFRKELGEQILQKVKLEEEIREGLARKEFELYFQPQFVGESDEIDALEMLLRWNHPQRGFLLPDEFIPVAEQSQLIDELTQYVLRETLLQGADWIKRGFELPRISVNMSSVQLTRYCADRLSLLLEDTDFPEDKLELEINEGLVMKRGDNGVAELTKMQLMGVTLTMDDFGIGYSSFSQLKKLPINKIKIDQSFIRNLETDQDDQTIVRTIIAMGKNLNIQIVGEGVETLQQQSLLLEDGCDMIQGFYRHYPVSVDKIELLLKQAH